MQCPAMGADPGPLTSRIASALTPKLVSRLRLGARHTECTCVSALTVSSVASALELRCGSTNSGREIRVWNRPPCAADRSDATAACEQPSCAGAEKAQPHEHVRPAAQHLVPAQLPAADSAADGDAGGGAAAQGARRWHRLRSQDGARHVQCSSWRVLHVSGHALVTYVPYTGFALESSCRA